MSFQSKRFSLVCYDFGILENALEYLKMNSNLVSYAFICHDRDFNDDGEIKKLHYHLFLDFASRITDTKLRKLFNTEIVQVCKNMSGYIAYFLHLYDKDKYQYDENDIVSYNLNIKDILNTEYAKYKNDNDLLIGLFNNIKDMNYREAFQYVLENNLLSIYKEYYFIFRDIIKYK